MSFHYTKEELIKKCTLIFFKNVCCIILLGGVRKIFGKKNKEIKRVFQLRMVWESF